MEVCDIVQEAITKAIAKKKKCTKTKGLFGKVLQITKKRREAKGKGKKRKDIPI